jgi:signal recognition particle GTPase
MASDFNLDDFARQLRQFKQIVRHPDVLSHVLDYFREDRRTVFARIERIIGAMTAEERQNPDRLGPNERQRIASACCLDPKNIEAVLEEFCKAPGSDATDGRGGVWHRLMVVLGKRRLPESSET